jgi:hypothetical protein
MLPAVGNRSGPESRERYNPETNSPDLISSCERRLSRAPSLRAESSQKSERGSGASVQAPALLRLTLLTGHLPSERIPIHGFEPKQIAAALI